MQGAWHREIVHHKYTPRYNGVAERKNRTIMNMAHSMLSHKKLSNEYWAEVVGCSVYLLNRSPTVIFQDKIPEEAWSGTKTSVSHLRIFGYVAFAHIPDELKRNIDKKSEHCIFTGYSEQHKEYKLYNPVTKKLVVRKDVNFIEDKCWSDPLDIQQEERSDLPDLPIRLPILEVQQQEATSENPP